MSLLTNILCPRIIGSDFVTLEYAPEEIGDDTEEVIVTATWNGPFQLSESYAEAKWYTVGIHKYYEDENNLWTYNSDNATVKPESVATDNYSGVTDARLFCFVGNPFDGITIYNKAAGSGLKLYRRGDNAQVTMDATATAWIPKASEQGSIANGYFCLQPSGSSYFINYDVPNSKLGGWNQADYGSTCWVFTPSQYPLNFLNEMALDAPSGVVGTKAVAEDVRQAAIDLRDYYAENPFSFVSATAVERATLDQLASASTITLGEGYYRFVSAYNAFTNRPAMYFDSSVNKIRWAATANNANNINGIFKLASAEGDNAYSIFALNGQKYLSNGGGVLGDETVVTITEAATGTANYSLYLAEGYNNNHHYLHAEGHNSGAGTVGNLTAWNAGANSASAWYIVPVSSVDLSLNDGGDGSYYATMCLPFDVTLSAACAYTLTLNASKTGLTLSDAMSEVPAGTPVLLRYTGGTVTASIAADAATNAPLTTPGLTGIYLAKAVEGDKDYFLGKLEGKVGFYHWSGTTLSANRAYFEASKLSGTDVKGLVLDFEDNATGISNLNVNDNLNENIYNLSGQRLSKMQKGINIVNGKKILK